MNRTDWNNLYRQIRSNQQPESINANGRKYIVGQSGVKPVSGRAVLFSMFRYCRMFERHSLRVGTLRNARNYRLELRDAVRLEVATFGQADQPGLAFC